MRMNHEDADQTIPYAPSPMHLEHAICAIDGETVEPGIREGHERRRGGENKVS